MRQRYRYGLTAAQKTELWDRYQRGESLRAIGRAFGKPSSSIYGQLAPHGGIRPAPRRRWRLALSLSEREEISRGIVAQQSMRSVAALLERAPSTRCSPRPLCPCRSQTMAGALTCSGHSRHAPTSTPPSTMISRPISPS
ncbi:MAG: helix-turn-helix domain-containing protein [Proteobacteria bacterium]|nr:helix-turn-helix domain-containing protein [Pseudomonadota bacterium]